MPDLTLSALVVVGLTFVLAGFVKGVIGMGLPTVAVGALALVMAPAQAAALLSCHRSSPMSGNCWPDPASSACSVNSGR